MTPWSPQSAQLQEILQTIYDSTDTRNKVQKTITRKLNSFVLVPDYIAYLAHILAALPQEDDQIRTIAGYLLKNNASLILEASPEGAEYVKASVLVAFSDPSASVRTAAGQDIATFLDVLEPRNWPDCLEHLVGMLDDPNGQEAAFSVFKKACEDFPRKLDIGINGTRPLDFMVPKFLLLSEHPSPRIRSHAIACLSLFVPIKSRSLFAHIDTFIACLSDRALDEDPSVRRHVCQALPFLLGAWPDKLVPVLASVAEYMLYSIKDKDHCVALEACEFWLTFAEHPVFAPHLHPLLGRLAPALLDCMVYCEDDLRWLEDGKNTTVPNKGSGIRPRHYATEAHGLERDRAKTTCERVKRIACGQATIDYEDDDGLESDEFTAEISMEWSPRKCAAAALGALAVRFGADLMNVLFTLLKDKICSIEWLQRESAIFALGTMAEGCVDHIEEHLSVLIPHLLNTLDDVMPLVRSTTCWMLGRYASWCTGQILGDRKNRYFISTVEGLLRMILDDNKHVQEAACNAFATFEHVAGTKLCPYLEPILRSLVFALLKYRQENMCILYETIGTLANAVGRALSNPQYAEILMPPLGSRWNILQDDDTDMIPLLKCLSSVVPAMGPGFAPYANLFFHRCVNIVHKSLRQHESYQQNIDMDEPNNPFLVASLDLLSGLVQGLGMSLELAFSSIKPDVDIFLLLASCWIHPQSSVRQSAYALVGDLAIGCFILLRPYLPALMPALILQLDPEPKVEFLGAYNNLTWSVGEIALRYKRGDPEFRHWVNPLIDRLVPILLYPGAPRSLQENAAVSIGLIGFAHPALVARRLPEFAQAWCEVLYEIPESEETDISFRGFCMLVKMNPASIVRSLLWFCNAVVRWNNPSPELNEMFREILTVLRNHDPIGWRAQVAVFPHDIQERLAARYGV